MLAGRDRNDLALRCKMHMWDLYLVRISGAGDTTEDEKDNGNNQKLGVRWL